MWRRNEPYRLLRINAPEMKFKTGKKAKEFLVALLSEKGLDATIKTEKSDVYGRYLAEVTLPDGTNISTYMVEHGHARYKTYE
jgi:endonuclease YncB( thermonuclease family)